MPMVFDGHHIAVDDAVCVGCATPLPLRDVMSANHLIAALCVKCDPCDIITVLRYEFDPESALIR
jgi:hypothetical protein